MQIGLDPACGPDETAIDTGTFLIRIKNNLYTLECKVCHTVEPIPFTQGELEIIFFKDKNGHEFIMKRLSRAFGVHYLKCPEQAKLKARLLALKGKVAIDGTGKIQ